MRQVVIGIDKNGRPYVVHVPKKVTVIFKEREPRTFRKRLRTILYRLRHIGAAP